jgi:hypothetical protein
MLDSIIGNADTARFMSPERFEGTNADCTPSDDVFAFAGVCYTVKDVTSFYVSPFADGETGFYRVSSLSRCPSVSDCWSSRYWAAPTASVGGR